MVWSNTRIGTYLGCPCAYKLRYLDGEPQIANEAMLRGTYIHEAIERYALACWRGGRKPKSTDFSAGREIAQAYPGLEDDITRWVENTSWEWGAILPGDTSPVEVMYTAKLPNGDDFTGRVDLLQRYSEGTADDPFAASSDLWCVTDYKTGWATYPEDEAPLQLLGYAWLVQQTWPDALVFDLRIEATSAPWQPKPWRVEGDLSWVAEKLVALAERVKRDEERQPRVGEACQNCLVVAACPHAKTATMEELLTDPVALGKQVALLEGRVALGKKLLKAAEKEFGPVPVGDGKYWGWERTESTKPASARQAAEAIEAAGLDVWQYLGMTPTQFHAAQAAAPEEAQADFERIAVTTGSNSFGLMELARPALTLADDNNGTAPHAT